MRLLFILLVMGVSCAPKQIQNTQRPMNFDGLEISKDATAVICIITSISIENDLKLRVHVKSMKQGGSATPIFGIETEVEFMASRIFLRKYEANDSRKLAEDLNVGDQVLIVVSRDLKSNRNLITKLIRP